MNARGATPVLVYTEPQLACAVGIAVTADECPKRNPTPTSTKSRRCLSRSSELLGTSSRKTKQYSKKFYKLPDYPVSPSPLGCQSFGDAMFFSRARVEGYPPCSPRNREALSATFIEEIDQIWNT